MESGQTKKNNTKFKAYGFTRMGRPEMELDENLALIYDDCKHGRMSVAEAARVNKIPRSTLRYRLAPWVHTIVGVATRNAAAPHSSLPNTEYKDSTGINISEKNCNYYEFTVLFFMWKNSKVSVITRV